MITGIKITGRRGVRDRVKDGDGSRLPMRKPGGDYGKDLRPWSMGGRGLHSVERISFTRILETIRHFQYPVC